MTTIRPQPSRIYLLRHAAADPARTGQRDFDRELSEHGYGEAERVADKAVDSGYRPDLILSSTAARCRQTAEAVHRALGGECEITMIDAVYDGTLETYLQLIGSQDTATAIMLVGHNPAIAETLEALAGPEQVRPALSGGYPTAGLAILDRADDTDSWVLRDFVHP